ncbi:nitrilase-related carbon-nitrogen hydrolase [Aurantimonas sp. HBX-1]|uniref:nitrilase-related carbon-nitrogen hydrolase n=1 Tax=Aurantimonas sp. HBX-1 TaxID=2906072 RepID=UPI001F26137D|nr:nitrilase-related carbon-nitrogen hydrolase [Aurantimonas sp. HBX-1]UIJ73115.1 hydrolase [Aurantimonas sp. HBX-1]
MRVAAFQLAAGLGSPDARLAEIDSCMASAAGADLAVFPELAVTGYGAGPAIAESAADPQQALAPLQAMVDQHGVAMVTGLALRADDGGLANAAAMLRPGAAPALYAKRMLYGDYEKGLFAAGRAEPPIVEIGGLACGVLVCFDVEFPELVRQLALRGAAAVIVPTALPRSVGARFIAERVVPVRAFENQLFIVYADHCSADFRFAYQGLSSIVAPDGSVLAAAGDSDAAMLVADLDPSAYADCRAQNPYLAELLQAGLAPKQD